MSTGTELGFVAPRTLDDAVDELATEGAMLLGGATSVALLLKHGLVEPRKLVYLGQVASLRGLEARGDGSLRIGGTTTLREIASSPAVIGAAPSLATAAGSVGNPRVRSVATLGGGVVHGDPRQDLPPVLLSLGARAELVGPAGSRAVALSAFFSGFMETACRDDEIVRAIEIPPSARRFCVYWRFTPESDDDYPTVSVAVTLELGADGSITEGRIGIGGAAPTAVLALDAQAMLSGRAPRDVPVAEVADAAVGATDPSDDRRGSATYKAEMVSVVTRRALANCLGRIG